MSCIICHKEANHSYQLREFCNEHYNMVKSIDKANVLADTIDYLKDTHYKLVHTKVSSIYG